MTKELYEFDHAEWDDFGKEWKENWNNLSWTLFGASVFFFICYIIYQEVIVLSYIVIILALLSFVCEKLSKLKKRHVYFRKVGKIKKK